MDREGEGARRGTLRQDLSFERQQFLEHAAHVHARAVGHDVDQAVLAEFFQAQLLLLNDVLIFAKGG